MMDVHALNNCNIFFVKFCKICTIRRPYCNKKSKNIKMCNEIVNNTYLNCRKLKIKIIWMNYNKKKNLKF